jgi:hypothetical protein
MMRDPLALLREMRSDLMTSPSSPAGSGEGGV